MHLLKVVQKFFFATSAICVPNNTTEWKQRMPCRSCQSVPPSVSLSDYQSQVNCMLLWWRTTTPLEKESISPVVFYLIYTLAIVVELTGNKVVRLTDSRCYEIIQRLHTTAKGVVPLSATSTTQQPSKLNIPEPVKA